MALSTLLNMARRAWTKHPLIRDMTLFSSLFVGAELSQQTLLKKIWKMDDDPEYNYAVLARYAVFGVAFYPVIYNNWYRYLDFLFPVTSPVTVAKKVLMDQLLVEPPVIVGFYVGMSVMEGQDDIFRECRVKFLPTYSVGCIFWMPIMAINFFFVPASLRVTFVGACSFLWCNFRCWIKRRKMIDDEDEIEIKKI